MAVWEYQNNKEMQTLFYRDIYPENQQIIILLHGLGVDSQSWKYQEKALGEAGYRPIIPDLPGFGSSTTITQRWSIEECARILYLFASDINPLPIILIGISLGGAIGLSMLAEHPEKYSRSVLINAFSKIRPEKYSNTIFLISRILKVLFLSIEDQGNFMAKRLFPSDTDAPFRKMIVEQIKNTDPDVYKRALLKTGILNLDKQLKKILTPCLMITGAEDSTILPTSQTELAKKINKCQQIIIKDAGHAVIVQNPDSANSSILKFLHQESV
jgi:pimeloyl-ACP methyl ester carboxylesterase